MTLAQVPIDIPNMFEYLKGDHPSGGAGFDIDRVTRGDEDVRWRRKVASDIPEPATSNQRFIGAITASDI
jgi:hypothetical protein